MKMLMIVFVGVIALFRIAAGAASEGSDSIPYTFEAGDTARAEHINKNFDFLLDRIKANEAGMGTVSDTLNAMKSLATFLLDSIAELRKLGDDLTDIKSRQAGQDSAVASLKESLENLRTTLLDSITKVRALSQLPIGTIVASMLPPADFAKFLGADSVKWRLADGSPGTAEYKVEIGQNLPDLRGMFLRGLNDERADGMEDPEGSEREAGDLQGDTLKRHSHENGEYRYLLRMIGSGTQASTDNSDGEPDLRYALQIAPYGGLETRPRNVAVYWYIKVR